MKKARFSTKQLGKSIERNAVRRYIIYRTEVKMRRCQDWADPQSMRWIGKR